MKKQHVSLTKTLASGQTTQLELRELVAIAAAGARSISYSARWSSEDISTGTELNDFQDIEDFTELRSISLTSRYPDGGSLDVSFVVGRVDLRWAGAMAADKARRLQGKWNLLPMRAKCSFKAVNGLYLAIGVVLIPLTVYLASGNLLTANDDWTEWVLGGWNRLLLAPYVIGSVASWLYVLRRGPVPVVLRAFRQPFVVARQRSLLRDLKFVITVIIALVGTFAACVSAITDIMQNG